MDNISVDSNRVASAIAKVAAINDSTGSTGVYATANRTSFSLASAVTAVSLDGGNYIVLNGEKISGFAVEDNDASGSLVDAINAISEQTGIVASLSSSSQLTLTAEDARNIFVEFEGVDSADLGHTAGNEVVINGSLFSDAEEIIGHGDYYLSSHETFEIDDDDNVLGHLTRGIRHRDACLEAIEHP